MESAFRNKQQDVDRGAAYIRFYLFDLKRFKSSHIRAKRMQITLSKHALGQKMISKAILRHQNILTDPKSHKNYLTATMIIYKKEPAGNVNFVKQIRLLSRNFSDEDKSRIFRVEYEAIRRALHLKAELLSFRREYYKNLLQTADFNVPNLQDLKK